VIVNQQQHQVQNVAVAPHQFRNLDLGEVLASSGAQQASREMRSFSYDISTGDRLIVNQTGNSDGSSKLFALTAGGWITLNTLGRFGVAYPFGFGF